MQATVEGGLRNRFLANKSFEWTNNEKSFDYLLDNSVVQE